MKVFKPNVASRIANRVTNSAVKKVGKSTAKKAANLIATRKTKYNTVESHTFFTIAFQKISLIVARLSTLTTLTLLCTTPGYAATATASQHLRIIIPKIALLDTSNTHSILQLTFDPVIEAGDNFSTATANSHYDVTSNIGNLRLYGRVNNNLESNYNLSLKVNARGNTLKTLTTTNQRILTIREQKRTGKKLNYTASPAFPNKMIPYGNINVTVTYTLVEP